MPLCLLNIFIIFRFYYMYSRNYYYVYSYGYNSIYNYVWTCCRMDYCEYVEEERVCTFYTIIEYYLFVWVPYGYFYIATVYSLFFPSWMIIHLLTLLNLWLLLPKLGTYIVYTPILTHTHRPVFGTPFSHKPHNTI